MTVRGITYNPVGIIRSPLRDPDGAPIQPAAARGVKGIIEVKKEFENGLKDLEGFSHIVLIYHLHLARKCSLEVVPFLDKKPHGVFATRAPARPNPIGMSVVKLLERNGNRLAVENVDVIDGTPLLDIKPYVREFDLVRKSRSGWLANSAHRLLGRKADARFK